MGEISSLGSRPDSTIQLASADQRLLNKSNGAVSNGGGGVSESQTQLTKLSTVLSSLQKGTATARSQFTKALSAVRSGTYELDPLAISRGIVSDSLSESQ